MKINFKLYTNKIKNKGKYINYLSEDNLEKYRIIDGIFIVENSSLCQYVNSVDIDDYISIDYSYEGNIEFQYDKNRFIILSERMAVVSGDKSIVNDFNLSSKDYRGITLVLDLKNQYEITNSILEKKFLEMDYFKKKSSSIKSSIINCEDKKILKILQEIYILHKQMNKNLLKIKVLELIYYFGSQEEIEKQKKRFYFDKNQIEKIYSVKELMIQNPEKHFTIDQLSKMFNLSETVLKRCFKEIYNNSIYDYLRNHRMNIATEMLLNSDVSITDIALSVGYLNASKFSSAFKETIGKTPSDYRRSKNI